MVGCKVEERRGLSQEGGMEGVTEIGRGKVENMGSVGIEK